MKKDGEKRGREDGKENEPERATKKRKMANLTVNME